MAGHHSNKVSDQEHQRLETNRDLRTRKVASRGFAWWWWVWLLIVIVVFAWLLGWGW